MNNKRKMKKKIKKNSSLHFCKILLPPVPLLPLIPQNKYFPRLELSISLYTALGRR
jgi:hypothetical protein